MKEWRQLPSVRELALEPEVLLPTGAEGAGGLSKPVGWDEIIIEWKAEGLEFYNFSLIMKEIIKIPRNEESEPDDFLNY